MIEELINEGQYSAALRELNDLSDEKTRLLRLVCLNALGEYQQAKTEGMLAKAKAGDTYYDVVAQYVMTLKETGDFEEAINILVEELSMPYIPYEYESTFNAAYDEILLAKQEVNYDLESNSQIFSTEEIELILQRDDVNEDLLYMALDQMQQLNIRMLIPSIRNYLRDPNKPPFAKTLMMELMIEQQIDEEFEVAKNNTYYDFNPSYMPLVLAQTAYMGIGKKLQSALEDENPTLLNQCVDYLEYYLYHIYPKEIYEEDFSVIAAAVHYYVATLQNIEVDKDDIEIDYYVDFKDVERQILALREIE